MNKFRSVLEYDGTAYHGWQLQKELPTIQGAVETALERILTIPTRVHGAGRTDAGVHAVGQVAHFLAGWTRPPDDLARALNAVLPSDTAVRAVDLVHDDFHARHSARSKTYRYRLFTQRLRSPLNRLYSRHVPSPLDVPLMREASEALLGTHDFAAFGAPTDGTPSTVREILHVDWQADEAQGVLAFYIEGTGFLRHMVRSIMGTLVEVGKRKIRPDEFSAILESCERSRAGPTAPPEGLYLMSVEYPEPDGGTWSSGSPGPPHP